MYYRGRAFDVIPWLWWRFARCRWRNCPICAHFPWTWRCSVSAHLETHCVQHHDPFLFILQLPVAAIVIMCRLQCPYKVVEQEPSFSNNVHGLMAHHTITMSLLWLYTVLWWLSYSALCWGLKLSVISYPAVTRTVLLMGGRSSPRMPHYESVGYL